MKYIFCIGSDDLLMAEIDCCGKLYVIDKSPFSIKTGPLIFNTYFSVFGAIVFIPMVERIFALLFPETII